MIDVRYRYRRYVRPYLREPEKKAYTMLGLTLLALSVFGAFAIRPALGTIAGLRKEVRDLRMVDQQLSEKLAALASAQSQYKTIKKELYLLDVAIPDTPEVPTLLTTVNKLSGRTGVTINSMTFEPIVSTPNQLDVLTTRVVLTGTFERVTTFLEQLEFILYQMNVRDVTVSLLSTEGAGVLQVHLVIETFSTTPELLEGGT